jgi:hypothetical protein
MLRILRQGLLGVLALLSSFFILPTTQAVSDTVSKENTVYSVRRDMRRCAAPACGGWWVTPVNVDTSGLLTETLLTAANAPQAKPAPEYVANLEFSCVQWTPEQIAAFTSLAANGSALISGRLLDPSPASTNAPLNQYRALVVRDAFTAANNNAATGFFYTLKNTGIVCITAPCPSFQAEVLNAHLTQPNLIQTLHAVEFNKTFTPEQLKPAHAAMAATGLVVSGTQRVFKAPGGEGIALEITQIFWPFPAAGQ